MRGPPGVAGVGDQEQEVHLTDGVLHMVQRILTGCVLDVVLIHVLPAIVIPAFVPAHLAVTEQGVVWGLQLLVVVIVWGLSGDYSY